MSNELLQKVIDTTNIGSDGVNASADTEVLSGNGLLYPDQANRFLDYMWDATILAKAARTIRMRSNTTEIDRVSVGTRIMTVASEDNPRDYVNAADDQFTNAAATFSRFPLQPASFVLTGNFLQSLLKTILKVQIWKITLQD